MKPVIAAVDFSDATEAVVAEAASLAIALRATLHILHVLPPEPDFVGYEPGPQTVRNIVAQELNEEHHETVDLRERLRGQGIDTEALVLRGRTADKVAEEAARLDAAMVVIGSHGHGALYDLFLGSVSEAILRSAPCPVLVVPWRKKQ